MQVDRAQTGLPDAASELSFCEDGWLNDRLAHLHHLARMGYGQNIQAHIDTHLPAVAFLGGCGGAPERRAFARHMVVCISDSPQEGTLPDLGGVLRGIMMGYRRAGPKGGPKGGPKAGVAPCGTDFPHTVSDECYATQMLLQALPCIWRPTRGDRRAARGHHIGLNVLLGLLLGLYPSAVKFPPFHVRVAVYGSIHRLLTLGGGRDFCSAHPMLMTAAFMEYCVHVLSSYMPSEHSILMAEHGMQAFFDTVPVACDVFRQDMLNGMGAEASIDWAGLEAHCAPLVEKHIKGCKNRAKQRRCDSGVGGRASAEAVRAFSSLPCVTPYDVHLEDSTHRTLGSELAALDLAGPDLAAQGLAALGLAAQGLAALGLAERAPPSEAKGRRLHETVAAMQRALSVSSLPGNVIRMQLRSLRACMGVCERSALDGMTLYVCTACGLGGGGAVRVPHMRGQCRLDGVGWFSAEPSAPNFICSHCQEPAVFAVKTLGRIVTLRGQPYYLAPCCGRVQPYGGAGTEFQSEFCLPSGPARCEELSSAVQRRECPHQHSKPKTRPQRGRCEVCRTTSSGVVAPEVFTVVDHLVGEMRSIRLCTRHAPRPETLRYVANWGQLMHEVDKRDRPLFALGRR
jgi:hypothetical protein